MEKTNRLIDSIRKEYSTLVRIEQQLYNSKNDVNYDEWIIVF